MFAPLIPHSQAIRTRCLATLPLVGIAGAALGGVIQQSGYVPVTMGWFAVAMMVGSYVSAMLEGATLYALRMEPGGVNGDAVAIAWDLVLGGVAGVFLSATTSVGVLEAVGVASAILFLQRMVLEKVLLGNLAGDSLARMLHGGGGGSIPQYSHAAALAARGNFDEARAEYEAAIAAQPRDVLAYIALARMTRDGEHDYTSAARVLDRALALPKLDARIRASLTRELAELHIHHLGSPGQAATLLARFIASADRESDTDWARALLRLAKSDAITLGALLATIPAL